MFHFSNLQRKFIIYLIILINIQIILIQSEFVSKFKGVYQVVECNGIKYYITNPNDMI